MDVKPYGDSAVPAKGKEKLFSGLCLGPQPNLNISVTEYLNISVTQPQHCHHLHVSKKQILGIIKKYIDIMNFQEDEDIYSTGS